MPSRTKLTRRAAVKKTGHAEETDSDNDSAGVSADGDKATGMRTRKKERKDENELESGSEYENRPRRVYKKRKNSNQSRAGQQGRTENLFDRLPFELVVEILAYLTPKDLLELSRTNKYYRSILLSKDRSARMWKTSRRNVALPDLTAPDFSEPAYAALVFGTRCDHCSRYSPTWIDPYLRVRLCKACRQEHIVKVDRKLDTDGRYHPATLRCVVTSSISSSGCSSSISYTLVSDLEYYHRKLSVLQEDDEFDDELDDDHALPASRRRAPNSSNFRPPRSRAGQAKMGADGPFREKWSRKDRPDEVVVRPNGRVQRFVKERKELLDKIRTDAEAIQRSFRQAQKMIDDDRARAEAAKYNDRLRLGYQLGQRLQRVEGYGYYDARLLKRQTLNALVKPGQTLTYEVWSTIEPKVLAAIDKAKANEASQRAKKTLLARESCRQRSLRPFYDTLKTKSDAETLFPLFTDFLLFPSVKALWKDDDNEYRTIDEATWTLLLPFINDELDDYKVDLITFAVRLILSAHGSFATDEDLEEAIQSVLEGDLDSFFDLATSLLVCDAGCRSHRQPCQVECWRGAYATSWHWRRAYATSWRKHGGVYGSFDELLEHLHTAHNETSTVNETRQRGEPRFPICLPLQVASAVSALVDIRNLSIETAKIKDLTVSDIAYPGYYRYENSRDGRKYFYNWKDLVNRISLVASKADRARPPYLIPAPVISHHPSTQANWLDEHKDSDSDSNDDEEVK